MLGDRMDTISYKVNEREISVSQQDDHLQVNGKPISVQLISKKDGELKLLLNDQVIRFQVIKDSTKNMMLGIDGKQYLVEHESVNKNNTDKSDETLAKPSTVGIKAPLPGVVVNVSVQIGDRIKKSDVIMVIESMKMQIDVRSSAEGLVKNIYVEQGQQVDVDMPLVEIE
jgi:biotin carboxyl carrier protein